MSLSSRRFGGLAAVLLACACPSGGGAEAPGGAIAAAPTFAPAPGVVPAGQAVTISCQTPASSIYFTTDGGQPSYASRVFTAPVTVSGAVTLKAICAAAGHRDSPVVTAAYDVGAVSKFSTGYYVAYAQDKLPLPKLHWENFTHLILSTGALVKPLPGVTEWQAGNANNGGPIPVIGSQDIALLDGHPREAALAHFASQAHAHGVAALLGLGGDAQHQFDAFDYNTSTDARRKAFADQLIAACNTWGFDGVDFDWEAPSAQPAGPRGSGRWGPGTLFSNFTAMLQELKSRKLAPNHPTRPNQPVIITFPSAFATRTGLTPAYAAWLRQAVPYLDQVNPMSYVATMFGGGKVVWHQAPLRGASEATAWDIETTLRAHEAAGVPRAKLGIGLAAYGIGYHGAGPTPARIGAPLAGFERSTENTEAIFARYGGDRNVPYFDASGKPLNGGTVVHDPATGTTVVQWDPPGIDRWHTTLLALDDAWAWQQKVSYVLSTGYGGIMVWALQDAGHPDGTQPELDTLAPLRGGKRP